MIYPKVPVDYKALSIRKTIYGIGINNADYMTSIKINGKRLTCPVYSRWKEALKACRDDKRYSICDDWVLFLSFKEWFDINYIKGFNMNTVITGIDPYRFSPENCVFVERSISNLLNKRANDRGRLPVGVAISGDGFRADISIYSKRVYIGTFTSIDLASKAYLKRKYQLIIEEAEKQKCEKVKDGLISWANKFKNELVT